MDTTEARKEALWVARFLACLGFSPPSQPVGLRADNKGAISLTKTPNSIGRQSTSKYAGTEYEKKSSEKRLSFRIITSTKEMRAGGLTKALGPKMFKDLRRMIGMS